MATSTGLEPDREIYAALTRFLMRRVFPAKRTILAIGDPVRVQTLVLRVCVVTVLARFTSQYDGIPRHLYLVRFPLPSPTVRGRPRLFQTTQ